MAVGGWGNDFEGCGVSLGQRREQCDQERNDRAMTEIEEDAADGVWNEPTFPDADPGWLVAKSSTPIFLNR